MNTKSTPPAHLRLMRRQLILTIIVIGIAGLGAYYLGHSHAQSPYAASQAESGTLTSAVAQSDSRAANGQYVQFGNNVSFVSRKDTKLFLNNKLYQFTGINMYEANERDNCTSGYADGNNDPNFANDLATYDSVTNGKARVIRAWFYQSWATTNNTRDWSTFDHTLAVAQAHGFKVIPVLANEWRACEAQTNAKAPAQNNPRTTAWYQQDYKNQVDVNGTVTYRNWVQEITSRYKNNPTILAWQLMNEANAGMGAGPNDNCSASVEQTANAALISWASDIAGLAKATDPNHLVDIGTLPNWCGTSGPNGSSDFSDPDNIKINAISANDFCDFHDYNFPDEALPEDLTPMLKACTNANKAVIIGESGITFAHVNNDLAKRAGLFDAKFKSELNAGVSGIMPWVWNSSNASVDNQYEIKPADPVLPILGTYGTTP